MRRIVPVALMILLSGCGFLSRSKSRFFSLDRIGPTTPVASLTGAPIGVDAVELPPGLDRREVVVRKADLGLEVREKDQWTATLENLVLHTVAYDLADRLPDGMVILPGQAKPDTAMQSIDLLFEELAAGPDNKVVLDVRWVLHQTGQPNRTEHERLEIPIPSLDSAAIAQGHSQALAQLADRIVAGLGGR